MLKKIITGGQTEADRAALDAAIKLGIDHGGWIPKGRITETGTLPEDYNLREMPTDSYIECIKKNVKDSKGTLIIFYGKLTGDLYRAERETLKHRHQLLGVDLNQTIAFHAASLVNDWIQLRLIDVLYVIGQSTAVNPHAGKHTKLMLERALILDLMNVPYQRAITDYSKNDHLKKRPLLPKNIHEAVERLITEMVLKDKVVIANMTHDELVDLNSNLGAYIRNAFRLWSGNHELIESCKFVSKNKQMNVDEASYVIIEAMWEKLRNTHKLKVVK
ncbi:MAG: hypothetical protein JRF17_00455 [Deltaproteobacteria bacterium]|jgi:hypothetical protein|nr:hypothetical protein [Deltaproteobacteria bacterium]